MPGGAASYERVANLLGVSVYRFPPTHTDNGGAPRVVVTVSVESRRFDIGVFLPSSPSAARRVVLRAYIWRAMVRPKKVFL